MSEQDALKAMYPDSLTAAVPHTRACDPGSRQYTLLVVADQDEGAFNRTTGDLQSTLRRGTLCESRASPNAPDPSFSVSWAAGVALHSRLSLAGRGMELSTLSWFGGRLLSCDDRTGIIYELRGGMAHPRHILSADIPGGQFKCEWAAVRRGLLYIGGIGRPFRIPVNVDDPAAGFTSAGNDMVVSIDTSGAVSYHNFSAVYSKLCRAAGCGLRGYATHEAAVWVEGEHAGDGMWIFAPRRVSAEPFDEVLDEVRGGHFIIQYVMAGGHDGSLDGGGELHGGHAVVARFAGGVGAGGVGGGDEGGDNTGRGEPRGISEIRPLPGSPDILVALKTEEVGGHVASFLSVMRTDGTVLMPDVQVADGLKFEGLEVSAATAVPPAPVRRGPLDDADSGMEVGAVSRTIDQ
jgi:soluble calcium-activated nucleotidase 1